jgi:hypothetical protein
VLAAGDAQTKPLTKPPRRQRRGVPTPEAYRSRAPVAILRERDGGGDTVSEGERRKRERYEWESLPDEEDLIMGARRDSPQ